MAERNGVWTRIALALLPLLLVGLIAYGKLTGEVQRNREELDTKASREVMTQQYNAILRELSDIKARLR